MTGGSGCRTLLVGITGNSGSGQTTAAGAVADMCSGVCSLDEVGHRMLRRSYVATDLAMKLCAPELRRLRGDGLRRWLAGRAFEDPRVMQALRSTVHPRMVRWARASAALLRERCGGVYVLEGALLFELGLDRIMDSVLVVSDTKERCLGRAAARSGTDPSRAARVWEHQMDIAEKARLADAVIENSGERAHLERVSRDIFAKTTGGLAGPRPNGTMRGGA